MTVTTTKRSRHKLPTGALAVTAPSAFGAPTADASGGVAYAGALDGVYHVDLISGNHEKLYEHQSYVSGIGIADDGQTLISAGYDGQLRWYDVAQKQVFRTIKAHEFWSWAMAISPDGQLIASVTGQYLAGGYKYEPADEREPSIRIFRVHDGALLFSLPHTPSVQSVAFSADSQYVAAGNLMGEVRVWSLVSGEPVSSWRTDDFTSWGIIKNHHFIGGIFDLHFGPGDETLFLTGMGKMRDPMAGNGKQMWQSFAWHEKDSPKVNEYQGGEGLMETLAFHPSGKYFVMGGRLRGGDWNAAVFDVESGKNVHSMKTDCRITQALFIDNGDCLIMSGAVSQGKPKDGRFEPFGRCDVFDFKIG